MLNAEVKDEFCRLITKIEVEYKPARESSVSSMFSVANVLPRPAVNAPEDSPKYDLGCRIRPKAVDLPIFTSGTALGTAPDNRQSFMPEGEQT